MTTHLSPPGTDPRTEPEEGPRSGRIRRALLGGPEEPRWARPGLWAVLVLAGLLYAWSLSDNGTANSYYSAAVLSGTKSWKAFFFGSLDAGSYITVDKPPMALWVMSLSARIFGFSTWSLLLPQAAAGVASAGVLYSTVRRALVDRLDTQSTEQAAEQAAERAAERAAEASGDQNGTPAHERERSGKQQVHRPGAAPYVAGLLAALVLALTPITVAINRDNNPDTVLVLLLVLAAWACQRAIASGRLRPLLLCAFFVGCAFNTKMLQAFVVLPGFALVHLITAPGAFLRRTGRLLAAGAVLAVSSAWWMVIVDLLPASDKPYIGGSTDGTVWDLVIGYNGLGRVFGGDGGGPGRGGGANFGGTAGAGRLFNDILGGQISWLIPFAAVALVAGMVLRGRRPRTDLPRAALLLWGGWLAVHFLVFSFAEGTFHPYYSTALAPAIGALTGLGGVLTFRAAFQGRRRGTVWALVLALALALTGVWSYTLLRRTPDWNPWLAWLVAGATALAVAGLAGARLIRKANPRLVPRLLTGAVIVALVGGLAGPAAYAASAAAARANGTNPTAGPSSGAMGGPGGMGRPGGMGGPGGMGMPGRAGDGGGRPGGPPPWMNGARQPPGGVAPGRGTNGPDGGMGGGPDGGAGSAMVDYLVRNRQGATWLVAVGSAQSASSIILTTGEPVIAMGGFTGSDPAMTVAKLQSYVRSGKLRYLLLGGDNRGGNAQISSWVQQNCTVVEATEYGGTNTSGATSGTATDTGQRLYRCGT